MKIKTVELVRTAFNEEQYPKDNFPQIVIVGRSNVGKSTLINTVLNRKNLAKTSSKPGKTRGINFYLINNGSYLVDLPGYGYAKVSKEMKKQWAHNIETFLNTSKNLRHALLLIDIRRTPTEDDFLMVNWFRHKELPFTVVLTKADKVNKSEIVNAVEGICKTFNIDSERIIVFSSLKKMGVSQVLSIFEEWTKK
ncbi:GTP-binding protein [Thermoanaerobacter thermohydrosulfuricus]|uniref:Probable GTP-binding protein EngB n=2 Tax=Thermoanaerobacter thermohydrosulfuricus TaxID=1516 RepID=M8CRX7_THETY|nr:MULTISPECIES: ribosome biogenesis GTP-binding protein YihA/YsxC [Thermoanaerobacter]EMT39930.1 ribosome biogenesis GTP-binding protein YsxC/EngB [Thermoanaerobacter thermohydrosulfuricus WC1]SDF61641.1 GTP-binding protein [Thermoanaerobacter thermohydrosulfuricus]SFE57928.1 GTP-binding protein [Thermoanaerobacter thermohydrosulfuricus]